jgi:GT2 family glycosyltransferase
MISAVVVSYRSVVGARAALDSFREEARRAGLAAETVCVVNSCDPSEARELEGACDRLVFPGENLGYAGGLNAGIAASRGDLLLLSNPDVVFLPGSVAALVAALDGSGLAMAGPALFWDEAATVLMPPMEEPGPLEALRRVLSRDPGRSRLVFRRAVRRHLALEAAVRAGARTGADALSGAVMALARATFERVGPFDERYRLYYEENDWQRRLRAAGGRLVVAGGARVVHRYAQSSRVEPRAEAWFRESELRYFGEHFGERGLRALRRSAEAGVAEPPEPGDVARLEWASDREALVALSPVPAFRPILLARPAPLEATYSLPPDVRRAHAGDGWYARAVDAATLETLAEGRLVADPVSLPDAARAAASSLARLPGSLLRRLASGRRGKRAS